MKRIVVLALLCCLTVFQAYAVLNEKDLAKTLGVLRAELENTFNEQTIRMARFESKNQEQHANLINMMQKSNQIALMLYSQNSDFTFDMTYACQAATEQYRTLKLRHLPYSKIKEKLAFEIERYDALIKALQDLPPRLKPNGELASIPDSIKAMIPKMVMDSTKKSLFFLDEQGQADRAACLDFAIAIRDNYQTMLDNIVMDEEHYEHVTQRVKELNDYAMSRYESIQRNIFVNGGESYFSMLKRIKMYYAQAKKDVDDKYKPLRIASQWRGPVIVGISIFMLFYILLASLLSYVIMRWLLPKRLRKKMNDKAKRPFLTLACGVAIFAISIMIARVFVRQNFIIMAIDIMITFAWLMEAILISLLIRLKDAQIRPCMNAYMPFLVMAFLVIVFRIILIPNNVVNLIYPPILLLFTIWQIFVLKRIIGKLPYSDVIYSIISLLAMIVSCVASWMGFVLMAVQIMIWWTIQLTAIQTITCCYDMGKMYLSRRLIHKIAAKSNFQIRNENEKSKLLKKLQPKVEKGEYIAQTWLYDFINRGLLPFIAVFSVPASIYFAAGIFEMSSVCEKLFFYTFLNKPGVIQLSLYKLCLVLELYFLFRYLNYAVHAFYQLLKRHKAKDMNASTNTTLANNIITIVVWGVFVIASLIILQVPSSGISIVMAGLATGLGFAMKDLLENFVYGISLMSGRLRVGDYVECDGQEGKVESINYQSTQIVTLDGCVIAFQNAALFSKNFKNLTRNHGYVRVKIPVGVAYGSNVAKVRDMLTKELTKVAVKNSAGKNIIDNKQGISIIFSGFGDSSVDLTVICWVLAEEKYSFLASANEIIYNTLNKNKVEIPFPQRDIYVRHIEMPEKEDPKNE